MEIVYGNATITLTPKEQTLLGQIANYAVRNPGLLCGEERALLSKLATVFYTSRIG